MNKEDVMKTVDSIKGLVDDYEEALKHSREKTDKINELEKQLKDKYSTDTHILMTKDAVVALADKFEDLASEFSSLDNILEDISSNAGCIREDAEYNEAGNSYRYARDYAEELRILLNKETEEVE